MSTDALKSRAKPTEHPLEALHSPDTEVFHDRPPERESIAESDFNDIALDDDSAPVALTSQWSSGSNTSLRGEGVENGSGNGNGRPRSVSVPQADFNPSKKPSHKKTASTTTIRSSNNRPFILARLDLQDESGAGHRGSVDGQQKLQEEFARLYKEEEEAKETAKASVIDWGTLSKF